MNLPRLSICIPTYERLGYLREAVDSCLKQTLEDVEVVIGDDGESTELRAWAEEQAARTARVRYEKNPQRLGLAGNWNACARRARGEYVTFLGDDDRLLPEFAERLLSAGAGADVVFSNHHVIDASGRRDREETQAMTRRYRRDELRDGRLHDPEPWVWRNSVPVCAAIIRRDVAVRLGFEPDLNTPELELFARLAAERGTFHFVSEYLAEYRSHAGSLTAGGLRVEALFRYLEPIRVSAQAEPDKRALLARLGVNGAHRLLLAGDARAAAELCRSPYYPHAARLDRALIQRCFAALPGLGPFAYARLFRATKLARDRLRGL